jgi:hypothetical protein
MGVKGEASGDAIVQGALYVVIAPGATNANGKVVVTGSNTTVSGLLTSLGLDGGSVVKNCNVPARAHGAFTGPRESGGDMFD